MRISRVAILAVLLGLGGLIAGCDKKPEQQTKVRQPEPTSSSAELSAGSQSLLNALNTPQLAGGKLTASVTSLSATIKPGETAKADTRIRNEGDTPVTLAAIDTGVRNTMILFSGEGCVAGAVLQPNQVCDLFVSYHDATGKPMDNDIIISSDAKKTPQLRISFQVDVEQPKQEQSAPQQQQEQVQRQAAITSNIPFDAIAAMNKARREQAWGQNNLDGKVQERKVNYDDRYPKDAYPWTEATLPVDRRKVLDASRIIKAVLETPFNNIMCTKVIAVTDQDTWGASQFPGRDQPLIPAGTRFIGTCNAFTDEKAGVVWTRFITPDGRSAVIKGAANDAMGRGGLPGILDRRWFDKYGVPIIFSSARSMLEYLLLKGENSASTVTNPELGITTTTDSPESRSIDRFQNDMDQILSNVENDLKDTKEVLNVPGGTRIDIALLQDVYFKDPYTVVSLGDDDYVLPEKEQQALYRTAPKPLLAGADGGATAAPQGSQMITLQGKQYYITPAELPKTEAEKQQEEQQRQQEAILAQQQQAQQNMARQNRSQGQSQGQSPGQYQGQN